MSKKFEIAVLPGDGIGPEIMAQAVKVLNAVALKYQIQFDLKYSPIGAIAIDQTGNPLPAETLDICLDADAILLGAVGHPKYDADPSLTVRPEQGLLGLRKALDLFINIRPIRIYPTLKHLSVLKEKHQRNVDFVIYRELSSGIYFGEKKEARDGEYAYDICSYHRSEIERIAHPAIHAAQHRRGKLCLIDKANVLASSRLWRSTVSEIARLHSDVQYDQLYVDNAAMQMVLNPGQFDVIVTSNMFGDIISDLASVLGGSLGLLPSSSIGTRTALFEPVHGSYPSAAGKDIANPVAMIMSVAMMLEHLKCKEAAENIEKAVEYCIEMGIGTEDLKSKYT